MSERNVVWLPSVRSKLLHYRNERFTPEDTLGFVSQIVLETDRLLKNPVLGRTYTEESGTYQGVSRVLIRNFRIYYEQYHDDIVIVAILFPGER
ncbi:type II toxin-antitoxin system RelE/ParE family toxin [Dethiobacter alkaliphilus]|uniref:type II toxin-antitoxin system RelE/ParE family toxin n=1 Tax=Dethiobacter alkaliphilus TaxID=427926 RepID=UPI002226FE99|nr:type II toxin-antitoxin system RelE/ParE family toxin [Dethiobacter alkaliphilus]MCW3490019.1 type II toxin-antitoxin system RelE/ParE family toxin [Dethiobacter alkaliphilus]